LSCFKALDRWSLNDWVSEEAGVRECLSVSGMNRKARAATKRRIMAMHNTGRGPVAFIIAEERAGETRSPTRAATWVRMKRIALRYRQL